MCAPASERAAGCAAPAATGHRARAAWMTAHSAAAVRCSAARTSVARNDAAQLVLLSVLGAVAVHLQHAGNTPHVMTAGGCHARSRQAVAAMLVCASMDRGTEGGRTSRANVARFFSVNRPPYRLMLTLRIAMVALQSTRNPISSGWAPCFVSPSTSDNQPQS